MIFVGERRSPTAIARGWTWKDGHLAARPLFDGLDALGIDPGRVAFVNLFRETPDGFGPLTVNPTTVRRLRRAGVPVVAMGLKVAAALEAVGIAHVRIVHPAARGRIRKRSRYVKHICQVLGPIRRRA